MRARRLGVRVAAVAVAGAIGLGVAAGPASAMPDNRCAYAASRSDMAAAIMQEATSYQLWSAAYDLWLAAEEYLERWCADPGFPVG
jgi:hypothetical protein